ncbi:MAG: hypothetical protein LBT25_11705 [Candidatus Symbiothrix sp.]|jgi:hypothetical protein|nr:hypothetical protein [Candidatus Symbiothrix sp.]
MPDSIQTLRVFPQRDTPLVLQPDALRVHTPYKSFVGTGSTPLNLERLEPEFRGHIIFINGYISDWFDNFGSTIYDAIMDKLPERDEGFNGGRNANMDQWDAPEDRYKEVANSEDEVSAKEDSDTKGESTNEETDFNKKNRAGQWWQFWDGKDNKQHSLWDYWNKKENLFRFSLVYAEYFKSRGNVYYINGSHGLESEATFRMDSGFSQGYAWAKENSPLIGKKAYDKNIKKIPWLQSSEYVPITLVLHSQGNAKGLGVAKGIMAWFLEQGWKKMALNIVMLSVHQNLKLTGPEYTSFLQKKQEMLADKPLLNWLSHLFAGKHNKLEKSTGIDEYSSAFFNLSTWKDIKKRAVQFTFANDRGDLIMRMGDISGIANACNTNNMTNLFPFTVDDSGNITYPQGRILDIFSVKKGKPTYKELVQNYAKAYANYKKWKNHYEQYPAERYYLKSAGEGVAVTGDHLAHYISHLTYAYSDLASAEIKIHGAPVALGLKEDEKSVLESGMSIFASITQTGESIFFRDKSQVDRMITI